jgi:hypothetical protein
MHPTNDLTFAAVPAAPARAGAVAAAATGAIIQLDAVTRVYGSNGTRTLALNGVSLTVRAAGRPPCLTAPAASTTSPRARYASPGRTSRR